MPPQEWNGRRCRFVWRSRGFLTKTKGRLWQEQRAEWYPQPVATAVTDGERKPPEGKQTVEKKSTDLAVACWLISPPRHLRLVAAPLFCLQK